MALLTVIIKITKYPAFLAVPNYDETAIKALS
jgi:hypothetical protein